MADPDLCEAIAERDHDAFERSAMASTQKTAIATLSVGRLNNVKLIHYDSQTLLQRGPFLTLFTYGTVFTLGTNLYWALLQYLFTTLLFAMILRLYAGHGEWSSAEKDIVKRSEDITGDLQRLTPFIFGLFISLTISRWWTFRSQALGSVMDAVIHISGFMCAAGCPKNLCQEEQEAFERDVEKVMKLGVASIQCVTEQSRGTVSMDRIVEQELVTQEEGLILNQCDSRSQVLWGWITCLGDDILTRMNLPPPSHNNFTIECMGAANAITQMEAYHDSQLPFPYVHMIVYLVNINNLAISMTQGMKIAQSYALDEYGSCIINFLYVMTVATTYQAILNICFLIEDPLGDDITDFPILTFQLRMYTSCKQLIKKTQAYWDRRTRLKGIPLHPPKAALPPAKPVAEAAPAPDAATLAFIEKEVQRRLDVEVQKRMADLMARLDKAEAQLDKALDLDPSWYI